MATEETALLSSSDSSGSPCRRSSSKNQSLTHNHGSVSVDLRDVSHVSGSQGATSDKGAPGAFRPRLRSVLLNGVSLEWKSVTVALPPDISMKQRFANLCGSGDAVEISGKQILKTGK